MEDDVRQSWQSARLKNNREGMAEDALSGRRRTALQSLALRYRRFSNLGLLLTVWSAFIAFSGLFPEHSRVLIAVTSAIYFSTCSVMDRWLYRGVSGIDCGTMSVGEVAGLAVFYRKRHLQFIAVLLPMAAAMIGLMVYFSTRNIYFIGGVVTGVVVGLAIGLRQLFDFLGDYRDVIGKPR